MITGPELGKAPPGVGNADTNILRSSSGGYGPVNVAPFTSPSIPLGPITVISYFISIYAVFLTKALS